MHFGCKNIEVFIVLLMNIDFLKIITSFLEFFHKKRHKIYYFVIFCGNFNTKCFIFPPFDKIIGIFIKYLLFEVIIIIIF